MCFQDAAIKRTRTTTASDNHPNTSRAESLKAHFTADSLNFKQPKKIKRASGRAACSQKIKVKGPV